MTSRQRVLTAMTGGMPDRVPCDMSWGMTPLAYKTFVEHTGGALSPDEYFQCDVRYVSFKDPIQDTHLYDEFFTGLAHKQTFSINTWGVGEQKSETSIYHFAHIISPLRDADTLNEIIDFPLPDFTGTDCHITLEQDVSAIHDKDLAAAGQGDLTLFELAWAIRGFENFMEDMLIRPDLADCLLDRLLETRLFNVRRLAEAGVDVLTCGDDVSCQRGMIISPDLFRRFLIPRYNKMIHTAKEINKNLLIFFHTDGDPGEIIPDLIEVGVNILNPCQPECNDFQMLKKTYGHKLAFWGAVGIQDLLPFGTTDDIRKEIKRVINTLGDGGGLLLGPTHVIEPEVPWSNLTALYEAINEIGRYC